MNSNVNRVIVVLGSMRSGSTVLRQMIASPRQSVDLGEVFNDDIKKVTSFWGYINTSSNDINRYMHPHYWESAWNDFIDRQAALFGASVICVDTKVSCIDILYRSYADRSSFFFEGPNVRYIVLRRDNLLSQAISLHNAIRSGCWAVVDDNPLRNVASRFYMTSGVQAPPKTVHTPNVVDPQFIVSTIESLAQQYTLLKSFLSQMEYEEIVYEDMFDRDGMFTEYTIDIVSRLSGIPGSDFDRIPALKKQGHTNVLGDIHNSSDLIKAMDLAKIRYDIDSF